MEESKERLTYKLGDIANEKIIRHIRRYDWTACYLRDHKINPSNILDFGCGTGYGAKLFTIAFPETKILGYDNSKEAINYANENNAHPNIEFCTEYEKILKNNTYDAIILMDMIEHLKEEERKQIMKELLEHSPKAAYIISTPLGSFEGQSDTNPYHITCFTKPTFISFLKDYGFNTIMLWHVDTTFSRLMAEQELHGRVIAVCRKD